MKNTYSYLLLFLFFSISAFAQTPAPSLNGPKGGFVENFKINDQGEILTIYTGGQTAHISRDGGNTWARVSGYIGAISLSCHPDGAFYGFGFSAPDANVIPFGWNAVQDRSLGNIDIYAFTIDDQGVFFTKTPDDEIIRSENNGLTWPDTLGVIPWTGSPFPSVAVHAPKGTDYIYYDVRDFIANTNKLYRLKKDGSVFEEVYNSLTTSIANFCHDPSSGHFFSKGSNVLFSADGSSGSWQTIYDGAEVKWVTCASNGDLTIATDDGYFRSENLGATWAPLPGNPVSRHPQGIEMYYNSVFDRYIVKNLSAEPSNFFSVSSDFTDWQPINPLDTRPSINKVFVDGGENIYAAVGRANEVDVEGWLRSSDGGDSFQPLLMPNNIEVRSIAEGADSVLFSYGYNDTLYKSQDFGLSWSPFMPGNVFFSTNRDERYSFVKAHANGTVLAQFSTGIPQLWLSSDNGITWNPIDNIVYYEEDIDIHPDGDIYGVSFNSRTVLKRFDIASQQWNVLRSDANGFSRVEISPEGVLFVGGTYRGLSGTLISEDNGVSFAGNNFSLRALEAGPNGTVVGTEGSGGKIYLSRNNGLSWKEDFGYNPPFGGPGVVREFFFDKTNSLYIAVNGDFIHKIDPFIVNDNYIVGNVFYDEDEGCDRDSNEDGLPNILVTAEGLAPFYVTTRGDGRFSIPVPAGTYDVTISLDDNYWAACDSLQTVSLSGINDTVLVDFPVKANVDCPKMQVDLTNTFLRRCFENTYHARYCNEGTVVGENASVEITLDPRMSIVSSTIPWSVLTGSTYTFNVGDVPISECDRFSFVTSMVCDSVELGETLCADARVFPDTICIVPDPNWSGASLVVEGECLGDSLLFIIKNVGTAPMTKSSDYIIIQDEIVNKVGNPFMLDLISPLPVKIPTGGETYHMAVTQVEGHPGNSQPSLTVEKCGVAPFNYGFFNQFGQDDLSGMLDIECRETIGSYDPNDKSAVPEGIGNKHVIKPNSTIEYLIRFQNTGTDTAFNIAIIDTISNLLELGSFEAGASSHDYSYKIIDNGVLRFDFKNIMLPDSNINLAGSNGFVKYKITLKSDAPLGSTVYNAADIYFDFNDPIYTNQTFHLIEELKVLVKTTKVFDDNIEVNVYPNPFGTEATVELKNASNRPKRFVLFSITGAVLKNQTFDHQHFTIERDRLPKGIYFYEILEEGKRLVTGKVVVE